MNPPCPAVEVRHLVRTFSTSAGLVHALRGIDLVIEPGEFLAIMGPSGSGKSTLIHLLAGLDHPTQGDILLAGQPLASLNEDALTLLRRRRLGIIFQTFNLLDVLTAEENVALPLLLDGLPETQASRRALEALAQVGLQDRAGHLPNQLSGGEQQRVAIARALVIQPVILLADEPTGNLDTASGDAVLQLLRRLVDEQKQTLLLVTHDPRHAARADRLLRLRDGLVLQEQKLHPSSRSLRELLENLGEPLE